MPENKFSRIAELIETQIDEGVHPVGAKLPSERDLARKYGLSHMTVNKALASLVDRKILKRVYGNGTYVSRPRRNISSRTIGIAAEIADEAQHPLFAKTLPFFQEKGYITTVFNIFNTEALKQRLLSFLDEKPSALLVDGSALLPFEILKEIHRRTPLVFFHRFETSSRFKTARILSDYQRGGYLAARHLLTQGRRKIVILSFPMVQGHIADLFHRGCLDAFREFGRRPLSCLNSNETSPHEYERIFSPSGRPDGIIAFSDFRLLPALKILGKLRLRVPEDISVVGYYNTPWSYTYNFTSVSIQEEVIIEKAWESLQSKEKKAVLVEPVLVVRNGAT